VSDAGAVTVLFNAGAGTAPTREQELQDQLGEQFRVQRIEPQGIRGRVRAAVEGKERVIGIAGGDGTLHAAASVLAGTRTALLPVPTGTLNNFARRVGIETPADAAEAMRGGRVLLLPVGTAGDVVFLNTLTFGEYSRVVRLRERYRRWLGKWPAAAAAFVAATVTMRRMRVLLSLPDETMECRTPFVWIGMGWGSFPRVDHALERRREPDLEVAIVRSSGRMAAVGFMVRTGLSMIAGQQPVRDRALEVLHTRDLTLDARRRLDATADGEVLRLQPPVQVRIRDDALRVMAGPRLDPSRDWPRTVA
jgi:diacylglycerol kinase family enzyme